MRTPVEIYSAIADTPERVGSPTWSGEVPDGSPEAIFRYFNRVDDSDDDRLRDIGYRLPSLSVGDLISYRGTDRSLIVCPAGFAQVDTDTIRTIINADDRHRAAIAAAYAATPTC